ncbi:hypothetical protein HN51_049158 [Arachis hypogaea]
MDKAQNLRCGAIRFSKPNNNKRPHMNHKQSKGHKLFAMKKRSRESMLFDSEKVNHKINGILESPKKDGIKKSKVSVRSNTPHAYFVMCYGFDLVESCSNRNWD